MKKLIIYTALILCTTSFSFAEDDSRVDINSICSDFSVASNTYIRYGQRDEYKFVGSCGSDNHDCWKNFPVRQIQNFLALQYQLPSTFPTGYFGPRTHYYMQKFKKEHGLTPVSTAGPATIKKIKEVCAKNSKVYGQVIPTTAHVIPTRVLTGESFPLTIQVQPMFLERAKDIKYVVDWGDGSNQVVQTNPTFKYAYTNSGRYPISIGVFDGEVAKPQVFSYVVAVQQADKNLCDSEYLEVLRSTENLNCNVGSWLLTCPRAMNNDSSEFQNLALNSCMLKKLQDKGWTLPKINMPVGR